MVTGIVIIGAQCNGIPGKLMLRAQRKTNTQISIMNKGILSKCTKGNIPTMDRKITLEKDQGEKESGLCGKDSNLEKVQEF